MILVFLVTASVGSYVGDVCSDIVSRLLIAGLLTPRWVTPGRFVSRLLVAGRLTPGWVISSRMVRDIDSSN